MHSKYKINVIITYHSLPQQIFVVEVSQMSAERFLKHLLKTLTRDELTSLIKISCCQLDCSSYDEMVDFLKDSSWGNFYFNIETNNDTDTRRYNRLRNEILAELR
jgi:uncharacterized protein with NAD-binding domain and iron-sulfur cluster